jgi:hypothetical protein
MVLDQTSEAGTEKNCYELHARSGLRFIMRLQKMLESFPQVASQPLWQPYLSGHLSEAFFSYQYVYRI